MRGGRGEEMVQSREGALPVSPSFVLPVLYKIFLSILPCSFLLALIPASIYASNLLFKVDLMDCSVIF